MSTEQPAPPTFHPDRSYRLNPAVALRPEPFGALAYDFDTRRLSFVKSLMLVQVLRELDEQPHAEGALDAAGVPERERVRYRDALAGLLTAGTILPSGTPDQPSSPPGQTGHDPGQPSSTPGQSEHNA